MKTPIDYAAEIVKKLKSEGHTAFFAGGWVRDYLMEHPSSDIDIATDAPPEKILDLFPRTILVGLSFGVVIVQLDGHQFEVSTFRKDIEYLNGRKPEKVTFSSTPEEDASRRDFTINGLFFDPIEDKIYDFVRGMEDLSNGIIRTIGNPNDRFVEDRLRMIRAIRFASRFEFLIDEETQEAIKENADTLFPAVAMERIWHEFQKMAQYPHFDTAIIQMHRLNLLQVIFPQLANVHLKEVMHRVMHFPHFPPGTPTIVFLMELFPDRSLQEKIDICLYLRTSVKEMKLVEFLEQAKDLFLREKEESVQDSEWVHYYAHRDSDLCLKICGACYPEKERISFLENHTDRRRRLTVHIDRVLQRKPLVGASELIKLGVPSGRLMGILLKEAENLAILHNLNSVEEVLERIQTLPMWPSGE